MKKLPYLVIAIAFAFFSFTSCKASKEYRTSISHKEVIVAPETKKVIVIAVDDDVKVHAFKKTFEKNYQGKTAFSNRYLTDF